MKKPIIIISVLSVIALALGYWSGQEKQGDSSSGDVNSSEKKEPDFLREGLVAYYPFNGNASDETGNGYDGKVNGATLADDRNGKKDSCYSFDGSSSILGNSIPFAAEYTMSGWFNTVSEKPMMLINMSQPESKLCHSFVQYNQRDYYEHPAGIRAGNRMPSDVSGCNIYNKKTLGNKWHQVVCVKSVNTFTLYVDGVSESFKNDNSKRDAVVAHLKIGENFDNLYFDGSIDDIRIYNRALSEEEVKALYEWENPKNNNH